MRKASEGFESESADGRYKLCIFEKLTLSVTNGSDLFFQIGLDQDYFSRHKQEIGIEGSWRSYFDLFHQALQSKQLSLHRQTDHFTREEVLVLQVHYPLMLGATIKGSFKLYQQNLQPRNTAQELLREMLFRLAERP